MSGADAVIIDGSPVSKTALRAYLGELENGSLTLGGRPVPLARGHKPFARSWAEAVAMCDDNSAMMGFAAVAGTTGGVGQPFFKVWNASDDIGTSGSFRWAVAQAIAAGGGRIVFVPVGRFTIRLKSLINITGSNITIDAPGRNVRFGALNNVEMIRLAGQNIIVKRLELFRYPHLTHIDGDNVYEKDGIQVIPLTADKIWIHECTTTEMSDGSIDAAGSNLVPGAGQCRMSVTNVLIRRQDKGMLWGSSATSLSPPPAWAAAALDQTPKLLATLANCVFDGVGQRGPRTSALAVVHSLNNLHEVGAYRRDDGTASSAYAAVATTGGKLLSTGDYVRLNSPTTGAQAIYADTAPYDPVTKLGPGALRFENSVAEDALPLVEQNAGYVPAMPYSYSSIPIPADAAGRQAWADARYAAAGAATNVGADLSYTWIDTAAGDAIGLYPDGYHVLKGQSGYFVRSADYVEALDFAGEKLPTVVTIPRDIINDPVGGVQAINQASSYFAVDNEAAASTGTITTITGGAQGQVIVLRAASISRPVTLQKAGTGNLRINSDCTLTSTSTITMIYEGTYWLELSRSQGIAQGAAVADAVNAAAAPTQAEFNAFVAQFNLWLTRARAAGLII